MKKLWIALPIACALIAFVALTSVAPADNDGDTFRAKLDGYQETPSVSTVARGDFKAVVSGDEIRYRLRYTGLESDVVVAHIHFAQRHEPGGVIAHLCGGDGKPACPQSGEVRGTIKAADISGPAVQGIDPGEFDEVVRAMRAESVYANVHTKTFSSGEIRGQLEGGGDDDDDEGEDGDD